jgi:hypothetical protein
MKFWLRYCGNVSDLLTLLYKIELDTISVIFLDPPLEKFYKIKKVFHSHELFIRRLGHGV